MFCAKRRLLRRTTGLAAFARKVLLLLLTEVAFLFGKDGTLMRRTNLLEDIPPEVYSAVRDHFLGAIGPTLASIIPKQAFSDQGNVVGFGIPQPWAGYEPGALSGYGRHMQMITHFELVASDAQTNLDDDLPIMAMPYIGVSGKLLGIPPGGWLVWHKHECKTEFFVMIAGEMIAVGDFPGASEQKLVLPLRSAAYYPVRKGVVARVGSPALAVDREVWHAAYNPSRTDWAAFLEFATQNNDATDNFFLDPRIAREK